MRAYVMLALLAGGFLGVGLAAISYDDGIGWPALGASLVLGGSAFVAHRRRRAGRARFDRDPRQGLAADRTATIRIKRVRSLRADLVRSYEALIDDGYAGGVRFGGTLQVAVLPGTHQVHLEIDWCRSPTVAVDVAAGETVTLCCAPRLALLAPFYVTFGRRRYIRLWAAASVSS